MTEETSSQLINKKHVCALAARIKAAVRDLRKNIIAEQPENELTSDLDSDLNFLKTLTDALEEKIQNA